uniref:peptide-methionine (S)-S-oxide reductase n=1 Tax=Echeneis naucrates TaxID=173247 RepID=A0A665W8E1_ECHNA
MLSVNKHIPTVCFCPGMGCFWGAERLFWRLPQVFSTQVGYAGGFTPNPTYHEVCSDYELGNNMLLLEFCNFVVRNNENV